jgi:hypothetical protein
MEMRGLQAELSCHLSKASCPPPGDSVEFLKVTGKVTTSLDIIPLIVPADSTAARPAMAVAAKLSITPDGKANLTVTDMRPTVQLSIDFDPAASPSGKINLSFVPVVGANHFIEFRDGLALNSIWQAVPGSPHNTGLLSRTSTTTPTRFYRARIEY